MPNQEAISQFIAFMEEYVVFIEKMIDDESEKLLALQTRDLDAIEHSISVSLANAKQMENYEQTRQKLMQSAGFNGLTFNEVIKEVPAKDATACKVLLSRFEKAVQEIQFRNEKSALVAQDNLAEINPQAAQAFHDAGEKAPNQYERIRAQNKAQDTIFEQEV